MFLTSCILVTRLPNRFYYTWRLFFRQYSRLALSSPNSFLLKLFISPGRTGGFFFAEEAIKTFFHFNKSNLFNAQNRIAVLRFSKNKYLLLIIKNVSIQKCNLAFGCFSLRLKFSLKADFSGIFFKGQFIIEKCSKIEGLIF